MSKFIYILSLKEEVLEEKYIKTLNLSKELKEYIRILDLLEKDSKGIIAKIKYQIYINKKNKLQDKIREETMKTLKKGDKIILSKDIIRNKYITKIEFLLGKKNISYNSNSILQNSTILELSKQYNYIVVLFKGGISKELLEEYIKVFKYIDCYIPRRILKNEKEIENLNYIYGVNIRIITSTDISRYDLVINVDLDKEYLTNMKFKKESIIVDDNNYISSKEMKDIKIDKCIKHFKTRENTLNSLENAEKYKDYFVSQIEYLYIGVDK